jgi:very-short-patch-repair endonuclease
MKGSRSKAEKFLEESLSKNFPHWKIKFNDRDILNGLELDVYIPHLSLAIEWNGIFHFEQIHKKDCLSKVQQKDAFKKDKCKELGISLIVICDRTSHMSFIKETTNNLIDMLKKLE